MLHLAINVVIQPAAFEERREVFYALRTDIASSLIEEGSFTFPTEDLTLYARERGGGGELRDLLINDARPEFPITYTARAGAIVTIDGRPAIVMRDGQMQRQTEDGTVDVLDFDRYVLQLGDDFQEPGALLPQGVRPHALSTLFSRPARRHYDQRNVEQFLAEAHARLSAPLLNLALAMIALAGVLMGEFSRGGYARRIMIAAILALLVRLLALAVQAAADRRARHSTSLQYALPLVVMLLCGPGAGRQALAQEAHLRSAPRCWRRLSDALSASPALAATCSRACSSASPSR